jgi:ParB/RepB/Spo0J family partition protein
MSTNRQTPRMLPTAALLGHRQNVRDNVGDVSELTASIRQHGLIQPIVVTPHPNHAGKYLILAGHRRAAAALSIPLQQVPCVIRPDAGSIDDHLALMLVENIQRRNLSPVEKARAMQKLIDRGATQADVARRLGVTAATVNTHVMLLELDDDALREIEEGTVQVGEAKAAIRQDRAERRELADRKPTGRPLQVEPAHFTKAHPLAAAVRERCDHSTRPLVGWSGCGQPRRRLGARRDVMSTTTATASRWCRTCGWKGTYSSVAKADYAKRRHSCARNLEKARRAEITCPGSGQIYTPPKGLDG